MTGNLADLAAATRVLPDQIAFAEPDASRLAALIDAALKGHNDGCHVAVREFVCSLFAALLLSPRPDER